MTEWWEVGYPGGPMVAVPGFPRPLYPPSASGQGKQPSSDGPDVIAYKRTVSRAGRWPWQTFDPWFSEAFSKGKPPGDVRESGVAGVQRQGHLEATGWLGKQTFNLLRSIRIPDELPHAGEPAMDATAVGLIREAWEMFGGSEPPPPGASLRARALEVAEGQLGYAESPAGSNQNKFGDWYGMNYQPWCAMFASWCYEVAGGSPSFAPAVAYSYCPYIVADARAGRNGLRTTDDPIPGDLVVYDWSADTVYDHVGLFEQWLEGTAEFSAIEGNTSTSSNSNGGQVMRRTRDRRAQPTVFVRVAE